MGNWTIRDIELFQIRVDQYILGRLELDEQIRRQKQLLKMQYMFKTYYKVPTLEEITQINDTLEVNDQGEVFVIEDSDPDNDDWALWLDYRAPLKYEEKKVATHQTLANLQVNTSKFLREDLERRVSGKTHKMIKLRATS